MRVVSLLPAATEIVCSISAEALLVGRSHACDHPASVARLPTVTTQRTTYDPAAGIDAAAIDKAFKDRTASAGSLSMLNTAALADLRPDVILTQETCSVCAVDAASVRTIASHMLHAFGRRPEVVSLATQTIEGMLDDHLTVADALHRAGPARDAVARLRERLFRAEEHVNAYAATPTVGFMEWTDPIYIAGHWNVELIERAGGRHPLNETVARPIDGAAIGPQRGARTAGKSIAVTPDIFAATKPEFLVIAPCGLTLDEAWAEAERLASHDWFRDLPAARAGRVAVVDGSAMFNRPGPRLIDAFEFLVGWLQDRPSLIPGDFPWKRFATS